MDRAMALRQRLFQSGCSFEAAITADYGATQHSFRLQCQADSEGNLEFYVLEPQTITGITGTIAGGEGKLTFESKAVAFELLAQGQLSPISAPWLLLKALRGGYLSSCGTEDGMYHLSIDDSYSRDAMRMEIWFDQQDRIQCCQIYWQGRMLLEMNVEKFVFM